MLQLSNAVTGESTPQEALDQAAKEFEELLGEKLPIQYQ